MLRNTPPSAAIACWLAAAISQSAAAAAEALSFSRDIRPILSNNCFRCHGPDEGERKAKMRLDVPGGTDFDELVARISSTDPDEIMPPPELNKTLTQKQIETLKQWITEGAKYERHWAFVHPQKPPVPNGENPIDHFIRPTAPAADKFTLVRRVYLDLVGLPPTPGEADAFAGDSAPDAYEKLVDRLLASPRYGERWARRWLDLARYADTNGYEKDRDRSIWPFRDWVIRALNADMPFDQFTIEQLAGDLLPDPTPDQMTATGFHRNTMLNEEGGIDPLEFRFHAMTDRVATTGATWLGLTTGCAQCHTHKYDPITHTDYYGLMAYLNNADEPDYLIREASAAQTHQKNLPEAQRLLSELPDKWPQPAAATFDFRKIAPVKVSTAGASQAEIKDDASVLITGAAPARDTYTAVFETSGEDFTALRLETLLTVDGKGPGRTEHGNFVLSEIEITAAPLDGSAQPKSVAIASASADVEQPNFPVASAIDGKGEKGWGIHDPQQPLNRDRAATFHFAQPVAFGGGVRLTVKLVQNLGNQHTIGRFRVSLGVPDNQAERLTVTPRQAAASAFREWVEHERGKVVDWRYLIPSSATANFPYLIHEGDGVVFTGGDTSKHDIFSLKFPAQDRPVTAFRLEALPDGRHPDGGPGTTFYEGRKGDFYLTEFKIAGAVIAGATETYAKNHFGNNPATAKLAADGDIQTGWSVSGRIGERHVAVFVLENAIPAGRPIDLEMHFGRHYASTLGKFRLSASSAANAPVASERDPEIERLLAKPPDTLTKPERAALTEAFLMQAPQLAAHTTQIRDLRKPPGGTATMVMRERPPQHPRPTHRHHRGEFLSPKEIVRPHLPDALFPPGKNPPKNRLEFARWLVSNENPLTARVVANRQWAAFFGTGIVETLADFGMQGEAPSHPKLLDYLAVSLMENGWSIKKLHRQIVLSASYRSACTTLNSKLQTPNSALRTPRPAFSAFPRTRLEAEVIRDGALKSAGLLSEKMFGPPVRPPQPDGVTEVAYGGGKWNASRGEDRYRRSVYTYQKRTAPFAMFTTFDGGSGEACLARRDVSNTPLQALTLMNDPMFLEIAEAFGKSIAAHPGDDAAKIRQAFRRVLTRPPTAAELTHLKDFYAKHQNWTALARILLCLDEAITKG